VLAGLLCLAIVLAYASAAASGPPGVAPALAGPVVGSVLPIRHPVDAEDEDDEAIDVSSAPPPGAWDGDYSGAVTIREGSRVVVFRIVVRDGVGIGSDSRLDCGMAPVSLRISPVGAVSGIATMFGPTCLKSDVALRGRAVPGSLQLRVGTQYLELARP
jgi:hypothetical protein